uniref:Reverse transcriptase domain-containing protein n=1 Tax=Amphimedon queenslandica TaxID=400682 RepID=A0A1X7V863_AMPQE
MVNFKATLALKPIEKRKIFRQRAVPFPLQDNIEAELAQLEEAKIITIVCHSVWAAPIVAVTVKDDKLRLCGEYKETINTILVVD